MELRLLFILRWWFCGCWFIVICTPIVCGGSVFVFVLVCIALLYVLSSFAIILTRKRELVVLLLLSFGCLITVNVLWLFLTVPWVGLQFVSVVFSDHYHLLLVLNPEKTETLDLTFRILTLPRHVFRLWVRAWNLLCKTSPQKAGNRLYF